MPVSHKYKTIFVHIPRAAGSSIERALGIYGRKNDGVNTPCPDILFGVSQGIQLQHLTIQEIRTRGDKTIFEDYFKFAFIRNPFDRIVSAFIWSEDAKRMNLHELFLDVFAPEKSRAMELYRARHDKYTFRGHRRKIAFKEFLLEVASPNKDKPLRSDLDRHFKSQRDFLVDEDGKLLVDFIGRYENLSDDFAKVSEVLSLNLELSHVSMTDHVGDMYRRDLEMFEYQFME